jgi:predicted AAA+ superfamily ATPase
MPNEKTKRREIDGLLDAMNAYNLPSGLIITDDTEEEIIYNDKKITIIPAWKWLLKK